MPELSFDLLEQLLRERLNPNEGDCDAALYRYAASDCTPRERRDFEQHLRGCDDCRADLEAFDALVVAPTASTAPSRRSRWIWGISLAVAAVAAVILLAIWLQPAAAPPPSHPGLQIKGGYRLHVAVQRGQERFVARSGQRLQTGDTIGLFYTAPQPSWIVVLFADEAGAVTRVYPAVGAVKRLPSADKRPLPDGAQMEAGQGCEWLVAFFSARRPEVKKLEQALSRAVHKRLARAERCALPFAVAGNAIDIVAIQRGDR